jgi:hypothetical protein
MKTLAEAIAKRNAPMLVIEGVGMPLNEKRENRNTLERLFASLFNWSMLFYFILAVVVIILGMLYISGHINSYPSSN